VNINHQLCSNTFPLSPLVVLVGVGVDDVSDEAVVVAAVCRARVHCDADEVVFVALRDLCLALFPETCSTKTKLRPEIYRGSDRFCVVEKTFI